MNVDLYTDGHLRLHDGTAVRLHTIGRDRDAAALGDDRVEIAAEDADGRTVGRIAYARVYGPRAEVALKVDDGFWHRGLPQALLERMCARAAGLGISTFLARVRASDVRLLALLRHEFSARESRNGPHVDVEFATAAGSAVRVNHRA
jgi:GNAT superfamily N-acetyltransferase